MAENKLSQTALSRAMALCSRREYCIADIMNKLDSWGLSEPDSAKVIQTLIRDNFINEQRYAEAFVKDKFRYNKWGRVKIRAGLKAKKIETDIINGALERIDEQTYRDMLSKLLKAHRKNIKARNQFDLKGKLLRYGLSKGFESGLLYEILGDNE